MPFVGHLSYACGGVMVGFVVLGTKSHLSGQEPVMLCLLITLRYDTGAN
jgi:hypothetical protein